MEQEHAPLLQRTLTRGGGFLATLALVYMLGVLFFRYVVWCFEAAQRTMI